MNTKFYFKRLIALLIDMYCVGILITIPNFILWEKVIAEKWNMTLYLGTYQLVSICIYILYWYILEKYYHTTLGKKIMKLKVIDEDKSRNYLIRNICKFLPLDVISFLFTKDGRFWHDVFSKTNVVEIEMKG